MIRVEKLEMTPLLMRREEKSRDGERDQYEAVYIRGTAQPGSPYSRTHGMFAMRPSEKKSQVLTSVKASMTCAFLIPRLSIPVWKQRNPRSKDGSVRPDDQIHDLNRKHTWFPRSRAIAISRSSRVSQGVSAGELGRKKKSASAQLAQMHPTTRNLPKTIKRQC